MIMAGEELPLRIVDQPGGAVIRCLCGAEAASIRRATTQMSGLRASAALPGLAPDVTPAGILMMIVHARACAAAASRRPAGERT